MTLLSSLHAKKLLKLKRCPVCGGDRIELVDDRMIIIAAYECSAQFMVTGEGQIAVHTVCPAGSYLAAWTLNAEVIAGAGETAGAA